MANGMFENGFWDLSRYPCGQLNGSLNARPVANQNVYTPSECNEPIAFVVCRRTIAEARRRWTNAGPGTGKNQMKLANYCNRQFTDHISTFEATDSN